MPTPRIGIFETKRSSHPQKWPLCKYQRDVLAADTASILGSSEPPGRWTGLTQRDQPSSSRPRAKPPICTDGGSAAITSRGAPIGLFCSNEFPRG